MSSLTPEAVASIFEFLQDTSRTDGARIEELEIQVQELTDRNAELSAENEGLQSTVEEQSGAAADSDGEAVIPRQNITLTQRTVAVVGQQNRVMVELKQILQEETASGEAVEARLGKLEPSQILEVQTLLTRLQQVTGASEGRIGGISYLMPNSKYKAKNLVLKIQFLDKDLEPIYDMSITEIHRLQKSNVQLQAKLQTSEADLVRTEAQKGELEQQLEAMRQKKEKLKVENDSLRAKTQSLKLTCDDLKPKIGKLQAVVKRARQTREAFVRRWEEIKHLNRFNHKDQQLLAALAKILDDELKED